MAQARGERTAPACAVDSLDAAFPARWIGTTVGQVTVRARNVETPFKFATTLAHYIHRSTQLNVAMNELSFAPGDAMDSLAVKESVRRLRATGLYSEIILEGAQCTPGVTDFTLWTRDAWSLKSSLRFAEAGTSRASFSEVNVLGTGRAIAVAGENVDGRNALSVSLVDPHLFDTRVRGGRAAADVFGRPRVDVERAHARAIGSRCVARGAHEHAGAPAEQRLRHAPRTSTSPSARTRSR